MAKATLNLHVVCDLSRVSDCARALAARVQGEEWTILASLAAELVAIHETVAAGTRMLVVPARPADVAEVAKELRLVPAGRE